MDFSWWFNFWKLSCWRQAEFSSSYFWAWNFIWFFAMMKRFFNIPHAGLSCLVPYTSYVPNIPLKWQVVYKNIMSFLHEGKKVKSKVFISSMNVCKRHFKFNPESRFCYQVRRHLIQDAIWFVSLVTIMCQQQRISNIQSELNMFNLLWLFLN